jgi:hypothetical protein
MLCCVRKPGAALAYYDWIDYHAPGSRAWLLGGRFVSAKGRPNVREIAENAEVVALSGAVILETAAVGLREVRCELRRAFRLSSEELEPITQLIAQLEDSSRRNDSTPKVVRLVPEKDRSNSDQSIAL